MARLIREDYAPRHVHDCDKCVFLGRFDTGKDERYDLYFCKKTLPTVIARFGSNGPDYLSGLQNGRMLANDASYPLAIAYALAKKKGFAT